jgi:hypothetical protein
MESSLSLISMFEGHPRMGYNRYARNVIRHQGTKDIFRTMKKKRRLAGSIRKQIAGNLPTPQQ